MQKLILLNDLDLCIQVKVKAPEISGAFCSFGAVDLGDGRESSLDSLI